MTKGFAAAGRLHSNDELTELRPEPARALAGGGAATFLDSCGSAGEYSTKVPQLTRTWADWSARSGTVTCTDVLRWMSCLLMACKSGVRDVGETERGMLRPSFVGRGARTRWPI